MKRKKKNQKQQIFSEQLSLFSFGDLSFDSSNTAKVPLNDEEMTIEIEQESSIELQVLTFPEDIKVAKEKLMEIIDKGKDYYSSLFYKYK